ncbi:MAG: undecaprenyl-phosphate glucose phosphotransferase [Vicingaceae bacterium]
MCLLLAFVLRYPDKVFYEDVYYLNLLLFYNINWVFCTYLFGAYKAFRLSSIEKILRTVIQSILLHLLLVAAFWVLIKGYFYSRQILLTSYLFLTIGILIWRIGNFYYSMYLRRQGKFLKNVVIAGYSEASQELAYFFTKNPQFGFSFKGFFDSNNDKDEVVGDLSDLKQYCLNNKVEEVFCLVPSISDDELKGLIDFTQNNTIRLKIIPDIKSYFYSKSKIDFYGNTPVLVLKEYPLDNEGNQILKRVFDIVFSICVMLTIFSWLFPIVAILIKLDSKGPVFFKQKRSGKNYQPFGCYKFRSMSQSASSEGFKQATKGDNRITKVGAFLRKSSIDEMPQFINVLIGQMSIVGPRPHPLKLDDEYRDIIDKYMSRHFVKPGITGLSQIMGYRGETKDSFAMKARVNLDNFYIEHWSFFLDLKIIVLTGYNMFKHEEYAY